MTKETKKTDTAEVTKDKADVGATEDTEDETGVAETDKATEDTGESDESEDDAAADKDSDNIDYDKELEDEKKRGKPDPEIARKAFLDREKKRKGTEAEDDADDDKPLTRKDIAAIEARVERKALVGQALTIARGLTGRHANSEKEAQLIVARWGNRSFPQGTPLSEQLEETYVGLPHVRRRLIGERDEALRGLKGKDGTVRNAAGTHRKPSDGVEPKIAPQDLAAISAAGYAFNSATRRYEKKLASGDLLVRDPKTKATILVKKTKK